jgi:hypothetical protein
MRIARGIRSIESFKSTAYRPKVLFRSAPLLADTLTNFVQRQHEMKVTAMVLTGLTPGSKDNTLEVVKGRRESTVTLEILHSD